MHIEHIDRPDLDHPSDLPETAAASPEQAPQPSHSKSWDIRTDEQPGEAGWQAPLLARIPLTWETALWAVILVLAVLSRFIGIGLRAMSHDESLHALYSYYLYNGSGYVHNPMMHGPFLFHANALVYFLFGDNDFAARIVPALFGVFLVMSPLLLRRWLGRTGALVTAALFLLSPSISYYSRYIRNDIYIAVWSMLMILALFRFLEDHRSKWLYLGGAVLMLSLTTKEIAYIFGFIGLTFILLAWLWESLQRNQRLIAYLGGLVLTAAMIMLSLLLSGSLNPEQPVALTGLTKFAHAVVTVLAGCIPAGLLMALLIQPRNGQRKGIAEAIHSIRWQPLLLTGVLMFIIYVLLFTTFFTNPMGLGTGIFGSISYWLAQQDVARGGQPWYYYLLLLPMYEFLPLLVSSIGVVYFLVRGPEEAAASEDAVPEDAAADQPLQRGEAMAMAPARSRSMFIAFLIYWLVITLFIYSWAGEKMPWLVVHPAQPMIVVAGLLIGRLLDRARWREIRQRGGLLLGLLVVLTAFSLYTLVRVRPFQGMSIFDLQATGQWLAALLATAALVAGLVARMRRVGWPGSGQVAAVTGLLLLATFTIRFMWMANFINYDYATELLVYAHGTPDVKMTVDEVLDISRRAYGDNSIPVAYDSEVSWPMEWYMYRLFPKRAFYGDTPTREQLDVPVILASSEIDGKVQPFLGDRYYRFKRRVVWWPNQQYMGLTWERIWDILSTPEKRSALWGILYYRSYPRSTEDWYHVHNFYFYVRKDVAAGIWNFGAAPPAILELPPDLYAERHVELESWLTFGTAGMNPGEFNHPRGIAVAPDGGIYVVDSDNHRIQVFDAAGTFLREWGGQGNAPGQFQEPWGIWVDAAGLVYVADTWNHRIQVFDADGTFLRQWGRFGEVVGAVGGTTVFYGPRDVVVDDEGQVFVSDTGNKRIVVFDQQGNLLDQWGGGGITAGAFEEAVGLALDSQGQLYVADTWNQRVQAFDADHQPLTEWPVQGWYGESVTNKPYLAIDPQGRIYVTDPEGYRIAVFEPSGEVAATFGSYGFDPSSFSLPLGIAIDAAGQIYVTDTDANRVLVFPPLP
jgi:uncharacterized protein (TIGR03663 family)